MSPICYLLLVFAPASQEPALIDGAYHGPYDEVLTDGVAAAAQQKDGESGLLLDTWDRWEFWFEHQRETLFRGGNDRSIKALKPNGRYGKELWALQRQEVEELGVPLLVRALDSPHPELREAAALSLGRIGSSVALKHLEKLLKDGVPQVRQAALLGLGMLENEDALLLLASQFSNDSFPGGHRAFAALGLGLSGRPEAAQLLNTYLERNLKADRLFGEMEVALQGAVWAAGLLDHADLSITLIEGATQLEKTAAAASIRVRTLILHSLGALGHSVSRPFLTKNLFSGDVAIERAAALAIGRLGDSGAIPALAARLLGQEGDLETRMFCLLAAGQIGGPVASRLLDDYAKESVKHRNLRAAWGIAVGLSQAGVLYDDLKTELSARKKNARPGKVRRDEEQLRGALALGLGLFGDPRVVQDLWTNLNVKGVDADFAGYLGIAMGYLGGPKALEHLLAICQRKNQNAESLRGYVLGLGMIRDPQAAQQLTQILIEDQDPQVRWAAARAHGFTRTQKSFDLIVEALRDGGEVQAKPQDRADLLLALGYLGDRSRADLLASLLHGLNYGQDFRLLRCLRSY